MEVLKILSTRENSLISCLIGAKYFINSGDLLLFSSVFAGFRCFNNSKQLLGFFSLAGFDPNKLCVLRVGVLSELSIGLKLFKKCWRGSGD